MIRRCSQAQSRRDFEEEKMKRSLKLLTFALTMAFASQALAAPIDDLIKGAKQEGTLEFYAPSTLTPQGAQALGAAFNKKYGLNIKLQYRSEERRVGKECRSRW